MEMYISIFFFPILFRAADEKKGAISVIASYMWIWNKSQIINDILFVENRKIRQKN